jgi:hypothetical protein
MPFDCELFTGVCPGLIPNSWPREYASYHLAIVAGDLEAIRTQRWFDSSTITLPS